MRARFILMIHILGVALIGTYFDARTVVADEIDHNNTRSRTRPVKVGLVSSLNQRPMAHHFVEMAISDFYHQHPNYTARLLLRLRDSRSDPLTSAVAVEDLIKNEKVITIIGAETSQEAQFDISLGERSHVPIISYSASSPMLSSPYFIQATQDDSSQVQAIASIIQAFGWREVTLVYADNEFGGGIMPFLVDALQQINTRIPYRYGIPSSASDDRIAKELSQLRDMHTRVFVVHMNITLASRLFSLAAKYGMLSLEYVWIITSNVANTLAYLDHEVLQLMQGVVGVKTYIPKSKEVESFKHRWKKSYEEVGDLDLSNLPMSLYGLWAYDAAFMLAEAVEHFRDSSFTFKGVISDVGPYLIESLDNTSVRGLSGNFSIVNGKLQTGAFEIINVLGTRERNIGFWTPENGLVRNLDATRTSDNAYSTSKDNLGSIIWPGDSTGIPKGWVVATKEKPLMIGVPINIGFTELVKVSKDSSHQTVVSGFCIDVFDAVRKTLSYDLPVKYIPFPGSYNDLISQVYSKKFDGLVGDVTIMANRSLYVEFTLPYMKSDLLMLVRADKDIRANQVWAFLRPLSWKLWVTTLCFFILIAFVVWLNEYQVNDEFRADSWTAQIGLCLFYSFSTMVFSHEELPKSNLSRLVMVWWLFTLLLLSQSYTATLTSILTVENLPYNDVNELLRTGRKVGYQAGSSIIGYLQNMGFADSNILSYKTPKQLHDLLSKGSKGGGIDAAFDEAPYINLFLGRYCPQSHYATLIPPVSRMEGLAFAFPIGSPLTLDISRGVLNVTEGGVVNEIWRKWSDRWQSGDCPIEPSTSDSLELESFMALFAITGGVCVAAVVLKLASFFHENRRVLWQRDDGETVIEKLRELNRLFLANKETPSSTK